MEAHYSYLSHLECLVCHQPVDASRKSEVVKHVEWLRPSHKQLNRVNAGKPASVVAPNDTSEACIKQADLWSRVDCRAGLSVPSAIVGTLILRAVRESGCTAPSVSDDAMLNMVQYAAQQAAMLIASETAATLAAYAELLATHF